MRWTTNEHRHEEQTSPYHNFLISLYINTIKHTQKAIANMRVTNSKANFIIITLQTYTHFSKPKKKEAKKVCQLLLYISSKV